ncbi:MAG TPA: DNA primase [Hyphomicrobiaceae bacterium]|nr:DNA primase [Hyphomicrobiaceae bacterium]
MKYPPQLLDEIRARLPVSSVVSRRVQLKKAGREWRGLSPFKQEKSPSFFVNDQKGFYHCFASGEHGDIFSFLMKVGGLTFPEAVEELAQEAGVALPKIEPRTPEARREMEAREDERSRLFRLMEEAQSFFEAQFQTPDAADARRYITMKRGLRVQTLKTFRIGYAPASRHALKEHLGRKGFSIADMIVSGMLIGGDDIPEPYDRFRGRVMFPITDLKGRIIAFGGRALDPDAPAKYLNSPETPLFHKGSVLFNAARARAAAHEKGRVIAVEGYMDVVALAEAGFGESVAPLGTALTEDQVKLLWRMADEPILCFDGDSAGRKAAFRAVEVVLPHLKPGQSVKFAFLPDGLDPDDLIRRDGAAAMEDVLGATRSLVDVLWDREWGGGDWTTPERRAQLEVNLRTLVGRIADPAVRDHYVFEIRDRLNKAWGRVQGRGGPPDRQGFERRAPSGRPWHGNGQFPVRPRPAPPSRGQAAGRAGLPPLAPPVPSDSLRHSRLVAGHGPVIAPREAVLLLGLLNHPWLIEEHAEEIANLDFSDRGLLRLRDAMLEIVADSDFVDKPLDSTEFRGHLARLDLGNVISLIERAVTHRADRFAMPDADKMTAAAGWKHALEIHRRQIGLRRALEQALAAYEDDQSEENFNRIAEIKVLMTQRLDLEDV